MKIAMLIPDNRDEFRRYTDPAPYFGPAPAALLEGLAAIPGCEVHVVCCIKKPMSSPEKIAGNIYFHSLVVPKWGWTRTAFLPCIAALRRKLRGINPDIVHGQGTERYCGLAAAFSGFPNVLTIHGNMVAIARVLDAKFGSFYWLMTKFENLALAKIGGVFCNSAYTEDLVRPRTRKTWRVSNAILDCYFSPLPEKPAPTRPVLINIGVVGIRKRQVEILKMCAKLHKSGRRFEMQFVGNCSSGSAYDREFLALVETGEKAGYARYLGTKDAGEVVACLDAAHAMVHFPSEESFGLVAAEALARNLKFFGSRTGGIIDIAANVEDAELIDAGDWDGLQQAIGRWLESGAPQPLSAAAEIRARYHPLHIAQRHMEIYHEVLAST